MKFDPYQHYPSGQGLPTVGFGMPDPAHYPPGLSPQAVERHRIVGKYLRFWPLVTANASLSKYPGTKVGCVILGPRFEPLSSGWNGAPRGSDADVDGRLTNRDTRLLWAVHAEANAVANAAASGTSLLGGVALVSLMPCMACAKLLVQAGIEMVIVPKPDAETESRWRADFGATRLLLAEVGVDLVEIEESDITGEKAHGL